MCMWLVISPSLMAHGYLTRDLHGMKNYPSLVLRKRGARKGLFQNSHPPTLCPHLPDVLSCAVRTRILCGQGGGTVASVVGARLVGAALSL